MFSSAKENKSPVFEKPPRFFMWGWRKLRMWNLTGGEKMQVNWGKAGVGTFPVWGRSSRSLWYRILAQQRLLGWGLPLRHTVPVGRGGGGHSMVRRPVEPPKELAKWDVWGQRCHILTSFYLSHFGLGPSIWEGAPGLLNCLKNGGWRESGSSPAWFENRAQKGLL